MSKNDIKILEALMERAKNRDLGKDSVSYYYALKHSVDELSGKSRHFTVIDKNTGKYPDTYSIARRCSWAKHLVYCDIDGFALTEDGQLVLMDECGNIAYCPNDRFEIIWESDEA